MSAEVYTHFHRDLRLAGIPNECGQAGYLYQVLKVYEPETRLSSDTMTALSVTISMFYANCWLLQKLWEFLRSKLLYRLLRRFPWLTFEQWQDIVPNHTECMKSIVVRVRHSGIFR